MKAFGRLIGIRILCLYEIVFEFTSYIFAELIFFIWAVTKNRLLTFTQLIIDSTAVDKYPRIDNRLLHDSPWVMFIMCFHWLYVQKPVERWLLFSCRSWFYDANIGSMKENSWWTIIDKSLRKGKTSSVMQGFQQSMIIGKKIR